ncbi:hypothetical protein BDY24DRAFT_396217 [Mrakia frigida]|uniref:uncharacterized protein n=1 Tax=Mrakia frigida TaxID=29902 RepID=UPI003FCBF5DE
MSSSTASAQKEAFFAALADSVTIKNVNAPASNPASASSSSSSIGDSRMTSTRKSNQGHTHQSASLSVPLGPRRTNSAAESNSNSSPPSHSRSSSSNAIPTASNPFASPKEKKDASKKEKDKKSSRHADVIDKLDPSGFWGTGMFHHESAYDAAAPSRNKSTGAPMRAFDVTPGGTGAAPAGGAASSSYPPSAPSSGAGAPKLSPLAQHTLKEMGSVKFEDRTPTAGNGAPVEDLGYFSHSGGNAASGGTPDSPSGGGRARKNSKDLKKTRSRSKERVPAGEEDYINARAKEQKNALANAWGVADPEPFEDYGFLAATEAPRGETGLASASSSIWNGQEGYSSAPKTSGGVGGIRNGLREVNLGEEYDSKAGDEEEILDSPIVSRPPVASNNSGGVKRTKSLIQRIRHMRNNPNVPLSPDEAPKTSPGLPPSPGHNSHSISNSHSSNNFRSSSPSTHDDLLSSSSGYGGVNYSSSPPSNTDINGNPRRTSFLNRATKSPPPPLPVRAYSNNKDGAGGPSPPTSANSDDFVHIPGSGGSGSSFASGNPRTKSRSEAAPPSSARDKSLPRIPLASPAEEDPFSDPATRGAAAAPPRSASNARTPPPPVAPIPVPGAAGGYFPRTRTFEEEMGNSGGSGSGSGGAKLGRKGSLMKRVLGRG